MQRLFGGHSTPRFGPRTWAQPRASARQSYARPAFAPRPILDIKHIRQNPGLYEQNCKDRNYEPHASSSWRIVDLHAQWLELQQSARQLRERRNALHATLAAAAAPSKPDAQAQKAVEVTREEAQEVKTLLASTESQQARCLADIDELAHGLPNLSSTHTPVGKDPLVVGYINHEPQSAPMLSGCTPRSHVDIGAQLGIIDLQAATQTSGWGWYFLVGQGALLEQALVQYALHVAQARGWKVVSPPSLVYSHIAAACGFQPRDPGGEQQIYAIEQADKDEAKPKLVLAGTAEIPLAGMKANHIFEEADLPLKLVGTSRSYRAEAGARGVDTKGLYRVHEFTKVEMFAWTGPDADEKDHFAADAAATPSDNVFSEMLAIQSEILQSLDLPCRVLEMPTADLGASATRKRDIEAFFPSRRSRDNGWGEVTSASICTDYQTRRLHSRLRRPKTGDRLEYPYTLNGTALAVPRVLAAILENGWDEQSASVAIPAVLRSWMGGLERITRT